MGVRIFTKTVLIALFVHVLQSLLKSSAIAR